jgi:hypothetical protein
MSSTKRIGCSSFFPICTLLDQSLMISKQLESTMAKHTTSLARKPKKALLEAQFLSIGYILQLGNYQLLYNETKLDL